MASELKIPDDLKEQYTYYRSLWDRRSEQVPAWPEHLMNLIERIARLEAPVSDEEWESLCIKQAIFTGCESKDDPPEPILNWQSWISQQRLNALIAARSKP